MTMASILEISQARTSNPWAVCAAAVAAVMALVIDLSFPAVLATGVVYLGVVLTGWWLARPRDVLGLGALATGLIIVGDVMPALGGVHDAGLANDGLSLLAIWATTGVLFIAKRQCDQLRQSADALRAQAREQTARLSAARTQAELSNRSASGLLSGMSHELRTPLNAIIGFSEIVRSEMFGPIGSDRYRAYMQDIHESGRHLLALINNLLDVARIEAGTVAMAEEDVDVDVVVRACLADMAESARGGQITLAADVADGLPPLRADKRKLAQILRNLVSNAIKFTPPGGHVRIAAWSRHGTGTVFQVSDTGIGIALKDIPLALAPFGQVPSDTRPRYQGTGLGLPLSKALVELHAGSLDLQSEPGTGTTVTVRFPAERVRAMPKVA